MTYTSPEKYSIAWFKLAELVTRREKERALSIYRLLAHSLSDTAYAALLEGEVLYAFQDSKAYDLFFKAAQLYEQQKRFSMALQIYEFLAQSCESIELVLSKIIEMSHDIADQDFLSEVGKRIFTILSERGLSLQALQCALAINCEPHIKARWLDMIINYAREHLDEPVYQHIVEKYAQGQGAHWTHDLSVLADTLRTISHDAYVE